jgi:hypothetical protein
LAPIERTGAGSKELKLYREEAQLRSLLDQCVASEEYEPNESARLATTVFTELEF